MCALLPLQEDWWETNITYTHMDMGSPCLCISLLVNNSTPGCLLPFPLQVVQPLTPGCTLLPHINFLTH